MSEATVKGAFDFKLIGGHVAKHEESFNVLGPGVVQAVNSCFADRDFVDLEAAFSSDGLDVFFEAGAKTESGVEGLGVRDALEHCSVCSAVSRLTRSMACHGAV